jgi:murein DD-endopeptidase MepM/ murein hydrolase activator NlpD
MPAHFRNGFCLLLLVTLLAACQPVASGIAPAQPTSQPTAEIVFATSQPENPSVPLAASTLTVTQDPNLLITPSPTQLPCGEDWCITFGHFVFQRPISSAANDFVERSYTFGSTLNGERDPHHGVEFTNPRGTPVLAAGDGKVVAAGTDHEQAYGNGTDFYGNLVMIEHDLPNYLVKVYTLYGHLSEIEVQVGDVVTAGQEIGKVGKAGKAMGMHLHFEVRVGGDGYFDVRNPELWIPPHNGNGMLVGRIINAKGETRYFPDIKVQLIGDPKAKIYRPEPYGDTHLQSDEFYQEVFSVGDLPAGRYRVTFTPPYVHQVIDVDILPGKITEVTLHARY